jgi:hypothetical protein
MEWRALFSIAFLLIGAPVFFAGPPFPRHSDAEARLLARLQKEHDPVKKSKEETRLARIKLRQAIEAYEGGNIEQGAQLLSIYLGRIKDSWQTLRSSGRNAARDSRGFKELDIELREDARLLDDLKRRIPYFDRGPIEKAAKEVEQSRAEVLQALFPVARPQEAAKPSAKTN